MWSVLVSFLFFNSGLAQLFHQQGKLLGSSFGVLGVNASFDYVIIGGGTAGLVLADRLTEDPSVSVAVIEAGSFYELDNGNFSQIPAGAAQYSSPLVIDGRPATPQPLVDWSFITEPQPGLDGRLLHFTQGKTLGGGSARNYMAYHRGTAETYDGWADLTGDSSYAWQNVLQYFKKSTRFTPPDPEKLGSSEAALINYDPEAFSSSGGPLETTYPGYFQPISTFVHKALQALGLEHIPGLNSGKLLGFAGITITVDPKYGTRSSSQTSFLAEVLNSQRTNLQVYHNTIATKILFDDKRTATGVAVSTAGTAYILSARKEIILSAGAFKSPQLLMLSGVGPATTLEQLGIPVISDLPGVGQNMWDHPMLGTVSRVNVTTGTALQTQPEFVRRAIEDFLNKASGPLVSPYADFIGWEKVPDRLRAGMSDSSRAVLSKFPTDWPELEILPFATSFAPVAPDDPNMYLTMAMVDVAPLSRGNVTLASADPMVNPLISPNWLVDRTDQEVCIAGFKRAREIMAAMGIVVGEEVAPGLQVQSDEEILAFLRQTVSTIHHPSSTNRMGKEGDGMRVLDGKARVVGVRGLRVVDASAFPTLPPGHPQSTVYMLAEKIADDIKDEAVHAKESRRKATTDSDYQEVLGQSPDHEEL
ncbi:MAG: hypothetical protein M1821_000971 [Bathelium mastoideum]|nr:MAG: hypothetical protein M1821_000971 [Bathelium mastoideum]KAI9694001.1 MAG: hypothetical protein M1822_003272 [Bathelium mastoideum]